MSVQIIHGNALAIPLADQSVHTVVTSPPYWGLRDYGVEGQLGLEPTFDEYLGNMLKVFAEVHRVLRDDGTLWLNMGDGYAGSGKGPSNSAKQRSNGGALQMNHGRNTAQFAGGQAQTKWQPVPPTMKPKDLIGQPWALAFALRAAGWYLRSDIIWAKPAPMPESVSDRPTKAHEYLFLLTKRPNYFFDQAAWLEPASFNTNERVARAAMEHKSAPDEKKNGIRPRMPRDAAREAQGLKTAERFGHGPGFRKLAEEGSGAKNNTSFDEAMAIMPNKRNRRTVWTVGSQPTPEAHFATFPEALVEPCLLAGCPSKCCPVCGQGWEPIEEKSGGSTGKGHWTDKSVADERGARQTREGKAASMDGTYRRELKGYAPGCTCKIQNSELSIQHCPGIAFDPFGGSGTVCAVANRMGRRGIMLELNEKYIEIARRRIFADVVPTPEERAKGQRLAFT